MPLITVISLSPAIRCDPQAPLFQWNFDKIMKVWQFPGEERTQFVAGVESRLKASFHLLEGYKLHGTPDKHWKILNDSVLDEAKSRFQQGVIEEEQYLKELRADRLRVLQERSRFRMQHVGVYRDTPVFDGCFGVVSSSRMPSSHLALTHPRFLELTAELSTLFKKGKEINHMINLRRKIALSEQITDSWNARDFSTCWKLARLLACTQRGPRRRGYGQAVLHRPSSEDHRQYFSSPPPVGMLATPQDYDAEFETIQQTAPDPAPLGVNDLVESRQDVVFVFSPSSPQKSSTGMVSAKRSLGNFGIPG